MQRPGPAFEAAWTAYLPTRTPADFDNWRHHAAWTAEKYARFDRGDRNAPPWPLPGFVFRAKINPPAETGGPRLERTRGSRVIPSLPVWRAPSAAK